VQFRPRDAVCPSEVECFRRVHGWNVLIPFEHGLVLIEGNRYRFSELTEGQELSMYISETVLGVATEPVVAPESIAKLVLDEPGAPAEVPHETIRLAQATPDPAAAPATRLPDTAGWSPLLALTGLLALGGGMALAARRRFRNAELT
jgi:hypothetical protein